MLRTMEQRDQRQRAMRERQEEPWDSDLLTINDCARLMNCSRATARRIFRWEPDVEVVPIPGSRRPMIRVPRHVFDRVMRRAANRWS